MAEDEVEALVLERQPLGVGAHRRDLEPELGRPSRAASSSMPGEMSVAVARSISAELQQVEREVAGPGADLERVAEGRSGRSAERLRELRRAPAPGRSRRSRSPTWSRTRRPRRRGSGRVDVPDLARRSPSARRASRRIVALGHLPRRSGAVDEPPAARPARRRAAARADRRAHAARRPGGELLVPAPPGRLRVDRRAGRRPPGRRPRLRRGLRLRRARRDARARWSASTPTRRPTSTRGCATGARTCASSATWSRSSRARATRSSSCRRSSTSTSPERCCERFAARGAGRLRLDAEPAHARARRAPRSRTTPGTCASTRSAEYRELLEPRFARGRAARPLPRPQAARSTSSRSARLGPGPPGAADHEALLRPLHAGDLRVRLRAAGRGAASTARSTSSPSAGR